MRAWSAALVAMTIALSCMPRSTGQATGKNVCCPTTTRTSTPLGLNAGIGAFPYSLRGSIDSATYWSQVQRDIRRANRLGVEWYRHQMKALAGVTYQDYLREGTAGYARMDRFVKELHASGLRLFVTLVHSKVGASCRSVGDGHAEYLPDRAAAYVEYVRATVERYDGDGFQDAPRLHKGIHHWGIGNEVDLLWKSCRRRGVSFATPEDYARLVAMAESGLRAADSTAKLAASFFAAGDSTRSYGSQYLDSLSALGALDHVDIIDLHDYSFERSTLTERIASVRKNFPGKAVWVLETSVPSDGRDRAGWNRARHARAVLQWQVSALGAGAEAVFWHTLYRYPLKWPYTMFPSNGLYACDLSVDRPASPPKKCSLTPSVGAAAFLADLLEGVVSVTPVSRRVYRIDYLDRPSRWLAWSTASTHRDFSRLGIDADSLEISHPPYDSASGSLHRAVVPTSRVPLTPDPVMIRPKP